MALKNLGTVVMPTHPSVPILLVKGSFDNFFQRPRQWQIVKEQGSDFAKT